MSRSGVMAGVVVAVVTMMSPAGFVAPGRPAPQVSSQAAPKELVRVVVERDSAGVIHVVVTPAEPTRDPAPPAPPAPDPNPSPSPQDPSALAVAARAYATAMPGVLRGAAAGIRGGRLTRHDAALAEVEQMRRVAAVRLGAEIDSLTARCIGADGSITDPAAYADVLERTATAMEVSP